MELIYFWVDGYKNLKQLGIKLNPNYDCDVHYNMEKNEFVINSISKDVYADIDIFQKFNLNIMTIMGANGSGKTNIISALSSVLRHSNLKQKTDYMDNNLPPKYCLILRKMNKDGEYKYFYKLSGMKISTKESKIEAVLKNDSTKVACFQPFLKIDDGNILEFPIKNDEILKYKLNNYFYYDRFRGGEVETLGDLLGCHLESSDVDGLKLFKNNANLMFEKFGLELNIGKKFASLNDSIITNRKKILIKDNLTPRLTGTIRQFRGQIKKHKYKKIDKFITDYLPIICFQKVLELAFLYLDNAKQRKFNTIFLKYISAQKTDNQFIDYNKYEDRIKFYNSLKNNISEPDVAIITPPIWGLGNYGASSLSYLIERILKLEEDTKTKDFITENFEVILKPYEIIIRTKEEKLLDIVKYFSSFRDLTKNDKRIYGREQIFFTIFDVNFYKSNNREAYSFYDLSTGEQRILKFFADIYSIIKRKDEGIKNDFDIINTFIFDEMDLSWHPEWQRKMIYYIIDLFENKKSAISVPINLIFTTHSPFILSDMPKNNVILLKNNKISQPDFGTFAANIHRLLKDDFFLESTIGEFAKKEINNIFEELKEIKEDSDFRNLENRINLIGEPILQIKLLKELENKKHEFKIKILEQKIKQLESKNNEKN